jgi:hypothetical protein
VFEGFVGAFLPEPRVLLKAGKELVNLVFGALNRTSQEKNHLDNSFVFGNPVVEGLTLILGLGLLIPVLYRLGGFENVGSSTINRGLDFFERWLEDRLTTLKVNVHLEEGLQDLFGGIAATTNSFLHLVEGVLGGVEESLIHRPVVVLGEFLDLFSRNGLNMLIKLVRADSLDEIFDSALNFVEM